MTRIEFKFAPLKFFPIKMQDVNEMKHFLGELDLTQDVLDSLFRQLDKSEKTTLANWKDVTKEDWEKYYGFSGVEIYNYLHPESDGIVVLIIGKPLLRIDTCETMEIEQVTDPMVSITDPWGNENAVWLGRRDSRNENEGVGLNEPKIVKRTATIQTLLAHLRKRNILLIKGPPMTGKTSMATLMANFLFENAIEKTLVINLSMVDFAQRGKDWKFEDLLSKRNWIYLGQHV